MFKDEDEEDAEDEDRNDLLDVLSTLLLLLRLLFLHLDFVRIIERLLPIDFITTFLECINNFFVEESSLLSLVSLVSLFRSRT